MPWMRTRVSCRASMRWPRVCRARPQALGLGFAPGERFEREALRKRLGILGQVSASLRAHADDACRRWRAVAEDGQWRVLREPPDVNADALCDELLGAHPDCSAELKLTRRCGESLAPVLRGQADPLSLLFPDGSLAETESLYQNSPPAKTYNGLIAAIFADCRCRAPPWTGRCAFSKSAPAPAAPRRYIVSELQELTPAGIDYTFTDVSPLFLKRAAEKFGSPSYMRFKLLDIGGDPAAQGFEPGRFDIVVAANVLHATPDLGITLANVRGLMRPGGLPRAARRCHCAAFRRSDGGLAGRLVGLLRYAPAQLRADAARAMAEAASVRGFCRCRRGARANRRARCFTTGGLHCTGACA